MPNNDINIYKEGNDWKAKRSDSSRASIVAPTQREAYDKARDLLSRNGGGEISTHGTDGKIRDKNTIRPAKDPRGLKG
ncbi:DUF2188 domain-containing protein [Arthrobacter halodurans]|uniref:DUF2188 domain-containing protein n=1 Tax=Arthrobacter halodurans TaxID=516699 RepID=A0ABV4URX8_9MICC